MLLANALVSEPLPFTPSVMSQSKTTDVGGWTAAASAPVLSRPLLTRASTEDPPNTHRQAWLQSLVGVLPFPGCWCPQGFVCALQESLVGMRFDFKCEYTSCFGFSFVLGRGVSFLGNSDILLVMVVQQLVRFWYSCRKVSACPFTLPPTCVGLVQGFMTSSLKALGA